MIFALALALAAQAAVPAAAPAAAPAPANDKLRVLVLDLRNDGAKPEHARLVTDNIVVALSRFTQLEVVSSEDVRRMVQTEGEKQAMGCTDDSCLTEIASAMGASLVVHGSIGRLESITVVNLSLYDSKAGKSIGREAIQVNRLDDLPYRVEDATARLVRPLLGASPSQSASSGGSGGAASSDAATPAPDPGGVNRLMAAGVGGAAGCCLGGGLFFLGGAFLGGCGTCVIGPALAAGGGAGAPLIGGAVGGAKMTSLILPALVGAGVAGLSGLVTGLIVFGFTPADAAVFPYVRGIAIGALPVAGLTGAAVAIATGLGAADPDPEPTAPAAERSLEKLPASRYAMAY